MSAARDLYENHTRQVREIDKEVTEAVALMEELLEAVRDWRTVQFVADGIQFRWRGLRGIKLVDWNRAFDIPRLLATRQDLVGSGIIAWGNMSKEEQERTPWEPILGPKPE